MNVVLGVRIEFYRNVRDGEPDPEGFLGAAVREGGFSAAAVPAAGDLLSLTTLTGGSGLDLRALDDSAFAPVVRVEHQPVATASDGTPTDWWQAPVDHPMVTVVVRVAGPTNAEEARSLVETLGERGWTVMAGSQQLEQALHPAR